MKILLTPIIFVSFLIFSTNCQELISPCPALFQYDPGSFLGDSWTGEAILSSDSNLSGIWMRIILDKPPVSVESNFGEVVQREPSEFLIRNPSFQLAANDQEKIRITVFYSPDETPPKLVRYRLNAKEVCSAPKANLVSPCPDLFQYDPAGIQGNKWSGELTLLSDSDLTGIWTRIILDKPPIGVESNFGEVVQREPSEFLIRNKDHKLPANTPEKIRITVTFNPDDPPPKFSRFRLNAKEVCNSATPLVSPCPDLFQYDPAGVQGDKWSGDITLLSDSSLTGIWLRLILDKPPKAVESTFGEVVQREPSEFLIRNPSFSLPSNTAEKFKITVTFNPAEPPPKLSAFRLNAKSVCPSAGGSPTPAPSPSPAPTAAPPLPPISNNFGGVECGTVLVQPRPLITHGQSTIAGQYPWHAAIYHSRSADLTYVCGGNLITQNHILTAAHCVVQQSRRGRPVDPKIFTIFLGKYRLRQWNNPGLQEFQVNNIIVHPSYTVQKHTHDIALMRLSAQVDFTEFVRPICLWEGSDNLNTVANQVGTVVGWGYDETGKLSEEIKRGKMPVVTTETCLLSYPEFFSRFLNNLNYCAGYNNGTSACNGDSGSGMIFPKPGSTPRNTKWHLRGLVSLSVSQSGEAICDTDYYVIFTDVAKFRDWIRQNTR